MSPVSYTHLDVYKRQAQEKWRLDVFNTHGKIYESSASLMFGVPIEQVTKGSDLRPVSYTHLNDAYKGDTKFSQNSPTIGRLELKNQIEMCIRDSNNLGGKPE